jgi:hypothetical protein
MKTKKEIADEARKLANVLLTRAENSIGTDGLNAAHLSHLAILIHDLASVAEIEGAATKPIRRRK